MKGCLLELFQNEVVELLIHARRTQIFKSVIQCRRATHCVAVPFEAAPAVGEDPPVLPVCVISSPEMAGPRL